MADNNIAVELKSDLEHIYKVTGDLLNEIETAGTVNCSSIAGNMLDKVRLCLMDTAAVLQKDIFNCDFIISGVTIRNAENQLMQRAEKQINQSTEKQ